MPTGRGDDTATLPRPGLWDATAVAQESHALVVTHGPNQGLRVVVDASRPARTLVGQSPVCDVHLSDRQVSRRHAALDLTPRGLRLVDLSSTNGTFVNDVRIVEVHLRGDETIRMGDTILRVERAGVAGATLPSDPRFGRVIGMSPEMRRLYPLCQRLAATDTPIVIEGETGTGKELMAEALHEASPRAAGPFVVFDCTTVPAALIESVLFGRVRDGTRGLFEEAHGGTLFVDQIADLDLGLQPKLLRAIERSETLPVGATRWVRVDTRIIAATQRNLDLEVQTGRFREDLFFRLGAGLIQLPPLRDRTGDVAVLTHHFWRTLCGDSRPLPPSLLERFVTEYAWPGNVRELLNAIARAVAVGDAAGFEIAPPADPSVAPPPPPLERLIDDAIDSGLPLTRARQNVVLEFERRYVRRLLDRYDGNVNRAAAASGLARRYFQLLKARYLKGE